MKFIKVLIFSLLFSLSFAQTPFNMVKLSKTEFINEFEITNAQWLFYAFYYKIGLKPEQKPLMSLKPYLLPESNVLNVIPYRKVFDYSGGSEFYNAKKFAIDESKFPVAKKFISEVGRDEVYRYLNLPVLGVTYNQACDYCIYVEQWLRIHQQLDYHCSLPPWNVYEDIKKKEKAIPLKKSLKKKMDSYSLNLTLAIRVKVRNFPNNYGIFSLWNNADEMVMDNGVLIKANVDQKLIKGNYQKPSENLGFRCYCTK